VVRTLRAFHVEVGGQARDVIAMKGVPNSIASIEELPDEELERLHDKCHRHAADIAARRPGQKKKS